MLSFEQVNGASLAIWQLCLRLEAKVVIAGELNVLYTVSMRQVSLGSTAMQFKKIKDKVPVKVQPLMDENLQIPPILYDKESRLFSRAWGEQIQAFSLSHWPNLPLGQTVQIFLDSHKCVSVEDFSDCRKGQIVEMAQVMNYRTPPTYADREICPIVVSRPRDPAPHLCIGGS